MNAMVSGVKVKDGFVPGWQENIRAYASSRREYDAILKDRGLVEIGKDYIPEESTSSGIDPQALAEMCADSGFTERGTVEYEAIKDGSFLED